MDNNHAGDKLFCRLKSDFLIYVNNALMQWFSKKQSMVMTSVFGTEFVTMKKGIDTLIILRYKFTMMGIPIASIS